MIQQDIVGIYERLQSEAERQRLKHLHRFREWLYHNKEDLRKASVAARIELTADQCASELINDRIQRIACETVPDQVQDIIQQLRLLKASRVCAVPAPPTAPMPHSSRGVITPLIAAFLGALGGVFFVAPQIAISARHLPVLSSLPPAESGGAATQFVAAANNWIAEAARWLAEASISLGLAAAGGAALGTAIVVAPPLFHRYGIVSKMFARFGSFLRPALIVAFRRSLLIAGLFLIALVIALGALLMFAQKPAYIAVGIFAFAGIATLRLLSDELQNHGRNLREAAVSELNLRLTGEADALAACCAGLFTRAQQKDQATAELSELKRLILVRKAEGHSPAAILPVVEQFLSLPDSSRRVQISEIEFLWKRESAERFNTYGVVEEGDRVRVVEEPLLFRNANGTLTVAKKGQVARIL